MHGSLLSVGKFFSLHGSLLIDNLLMHEGYY